VTVEIGCTVSATYNQHAITGEYTGPSSYPTGGFVIDLTATYSSLNDLDLVAFKTLGSSLNLPHHYEYTLNSPVAGKATVKIVRHRYDKATSFGNVQNQPVGVTVQTASGQTASAEAAHTHAIDHDHGSFNTGVASDAGADSLLDAIGPGGYGNHTHAVDLPNLTGTSGAGTSHNHADNTVYEHGHAETQTTTDATMSELPNATNISTSVWFLVAHGVRL